MFPAIAIADAVRKMDSNVEVLFVGAQGRMEMEKVPAAGYRIVGLPMAGIKRSLSAENLKLPQKLWRSMRQAGNVLSEFKPDVAVGVGGYASGPVLWQATRKGIPALIQEQNSYPGLTNRWLARRVQKICVAYEGMGTFFPKEKLLLTGNPVRGDLEGLEAKRQAALTFYGLDQNKKTLLIFGGSLGARSINEAVAAGTDTLRGAGEVQLLWQTGKVHFDRHRDSESARLEGVHIMPFIDRMDLAYAAADLVICRAGALTLAELAIAAKPAVLVPSPHVAADHQAHNAQAFANAGAARIVGDKDAPGQLLKSALALIGDEEKLRDYASKASQMARPRAGEMIAEEIFKLVKTK